jgi:cysteine sulfinate desulfinase/cysteine desulfurase-like protein
VLGTSESGALRMSIGAGVAESDIDTVLEALAELASESTGSEQAR